MTKLIMYLKRITSNIFYLTQSLLWKRRKDTILIGGWFGEKFADNPRFLYQYLSEHKKECGLRNVVWVSRKKEVVDELNIMGYEAYTMDSKESIYYHKTAKYHLICNASSDSNTMKSDILIQYSYGAVKVNLWHGTAPLKGVNFATREYKEIRNKSAVLRRVKNFLIGNCKIYRTIIDGQGGWGNCTFMSTSPAETAILKRFFLLPAKNYKISGCPRNCKVLKLLNDEQEVLDIAHRYKHVLLYLPTFRRGDTQFDFTKLSSTFDDYLRANNILWIQKAHSADNNNRTIRNMIGNTMELPPEFDINVLIPIVSGLITDYSSVWADAIFHHKPLIFFVPDLKEYKKGIEGFMYNPDEIFKCGDKVFELSELVKSIGKVIDKDFKINEEIYRLAYERWWERPRSYAEIWEDIKNIG